MEIDWTIVSEVGAQVASRYARRLVILMIAIGSPVIILGLFLLLGIGAIDSLRIGIQLGVVASTMTLFIAFGLGTYTGAIVGLWAGTKREWRDINLPTLRTRQVAWWANIALLLPLVLWAMWFRTPLSFVQAVVGSAPIVIISSMFARGSVAQAADWLEEQFFRIDELDPDEFERQEQAKRKNASA